MKIKNSLIALLLNLSAVLTVHAQHRAAAKITVTKKIPHSRVSVYNGVNYHYADGIYYRPYQGGYTIVRPPVGIHVNVLPPGFATLILAGTSYYYLNDVYYIQIQPNIYKVVEKPDEKIICLEYSEFISQLPQGAESISINGKNYYRVNDIYYEKITSENGEISYKTAGKKTK